MKKTNQETPDISLPAYYNNRELSWLAFNKRVLEEAQDDSNPLLEKLKFLAIFSSNLDEFFMVRVAGLKDQIKVGFTKPEDKSGLTPKQQVDEITQKTTDLVTAQYAVYHKILHALHHEDIEIARIQEINETQYAYLEQLFEHTLLPILTPMAVDTYHPLPKLLNKRINLAIFLSRKNDRKQERLLAIVQVPALFSRFIKLPAAQDKHIFILLEDVLCHFMYKLFTGYDILSVSEFRITRNADLTIDEDDTQDFLREIEKELKKRELGVAVRLEIRENEVDHTLLPYLLNALGIDKKDVYAVNGPLDLTFLFAFYNRLADTKEHLIYERFTPQPTRDFLESHNVFEIVEKQDVLLHHPYESFQPVIDFLCQAADDPGVMAIKQTLYRVSGNSPIINALKRAAENGKQVTVLLELKARFDEGNNVHWAKELEEVGCHVIYGMNQLKTHSKITLVVRRKEGHIQCFVHLGTGNYNDVTAKVYTDMGFFTSHPEFGKDAIDFFNYLSGYCDKPMFYHLRTSPFDIRDELMQLIDEEIEYQHKNGTGHIIAKMNSITDKKLMMKLYEASRAGVKIELIVRGICCLRPGIKNVSETITVRSIVGRFLEHERIFYFNHNNKEKVFISSADWMTRNMENRVEIMVPIYATHLKIRIKEILSVMLKDNFKAREQGADGEYHYVSPKQGEPRINSQQTFCIQAYEARGSEES